MPNSVRVFDMPQALINLKFLILCGRRQDGKSNSPQWSEDDEASLVAAVERARSGVAMIRMT